MLPVQIAHCSLIPQLPIRKVWFLVVRQVRKSSKQRLWQGKEFGGSGVAYCGKVIWMGRQQLLGICKVKRRVKKGIGSKITQQWYSCRTTSLLLLYFLEKYVCLCNHRGDVLYCYMSLPASALKVVGSVEMLCQNSSSSSILHSQCAPKGTTTSS